MMKTTTLLVFLKKIVYSGTQFTQDLGDSKKIILTNQIIMLLGAMTFFESVIYLGLGFIKAFSATLGVTCLYLGCFYLNAVGRARLSRYLLLILVNIAIFIYSSLLGRDSGMQYVYLVSMIIPLVIFEKNQLNSKVVFSLIPFLCFSLLEMTGFNYFHKIVIPESYKTLFHLSVTTAIGLSLIGVFYFYFCLYEEAKNTLHQLLKKSSLTQREIEIVSKIIEGLSNREIGKKLYVEESTVKRHVKNIFRKLNVKKRTELMAIALKK